MRLIGYEEVIENCKLCFFLLTVLALGIAVNATVFVYAPATVGLTQVKPPVTLQLVDANGTVGVNLTSANASVMATNSEQSLVSNYNFTDGANGWYYGSNDGNLIAGWADTDDSLAQGLIVFYNNTDVGNIQDSYVYILENFTAPEDISSENVYVRYRLASEPFLYYTYLYVGIYDYSSGSTTWIINGQSLSTSSSYSVASASGSVSLVAGQTYAFVVMAELYNYYYLEDAWWVLYIDYAELTYVPSLYRYSNNVIGMYSDQNVTMRMLVNSVSAPVGSNITLTLESSQGSSSIGIVNGNPNTTASGWVPIPQNTSDIYYSGTIYVDAVSNTTGVATVDMTLEYTLGGVYVYYPVEIVVNFTDPVVMVSFVGHGNHNHLFSVNYSSLKPVQPIPPDLRFGG